MPGVAFYYDQSPFKEIEMVPSGFEESNYFKRNASKLGSVI